LFFKNNFVLRYVSLSNLNATLIIGLSLIPLSLKQGCTKKWLDWFLHVLHSILSWQISYTSQAFYSFYIVKGLNLREKIM